MYNPAFTNPNLNTKTQEKDIQISASDKQKNEKDTQNYNTADIKQNKENKSKNHRLGPIEYSSEKISLFGFSIAIDDLLILGLILILLFESDCDYALIIVLGLMFFNINLGSLNLSNIF